MNLSARRIGCTRHTVRSLLNKPQWTWAKQKRIHKSDAVALVCCFHFGFFFVSLHFFVRFVHILCVIIIMLKLWWVDGRVRWGAVCRAESSVCVLLPSVGLHNSLWCHRHRMPNNDVRALPPLRIVLSDDCFIVRSLFVFISSIYFFAQRALLLLNRHSTTRSSSFVCQWCWCSVERLLCITNIDGKRGKCVPVTKQRKTQKIVG